MSESIKLTVEGMKCGGCETNVTTKLKSLPGVIGATASSKSKEVTVEYDTEKVNLTQIAQAISDAGYKVVDDV
jgi:copper chaperone